MQHLFNNIILSFLATISFQLNDNLISPFVKSGKADKEKTISFLDENIIYVRAQAEPPPLLSQIILHAAGISPALSKYPENAYVRTDDSRLALIPLRRCIKVG